MAIRAMSKVELIETAEALQQEKKGLMEIIDKIAMIAASISIVLKPKQGAKGLSISLWNILRNLPAIIAMVKEVIQIVKNKELN